MRWIFTYFRIYMSWFFTQWHSGRVCRGGVFISWSSLSPPLVSLSSFWVLGWMLRCAGEENVAWTQELQPRWEAGSETNSLVAVCCHINMLPSMCVCTHTHTHICTPTHRVLQEPWRMTFLYRSMSFGENSDHLGSQKRHITQKTASLQKLLPGRQTDSQPHGSRCGAGPGTEGLVSHLTEMQQASQAFFPAMRGKHGQMSQLVLINWLEANAV